MTDTKQRLAEALALMVQQYVETSEGYLDHLSMAAGEHAVRTLAELGLVIEDGRQSRWSVQGLQILGRTSS